MLLKCLVGKETQSAAYSLAGRCRSYPATLGANADCRQTKACCRDAADIPMTFIEWGVIHASSIRHQPGLWIGLLPKVLKGAMLQIFEKELCWWVQVLFGYEAIVLTLRGSLLLTENSL
jgi:hypothetical protein